MKQYETIMEGRILMEANNKNKMKPEEHIYGYPICHVMDLGLACRPTRSKKCHSPIYFNSKEPTCTKTIKINVVVDDLLMLNIEFLLWN